MRVNTTFIQSILLASFMATPLFGQPEETTNYKLDRSRARTTTMVQTATATLSTQSFAGSTDKVRVHLDYDMAIRIMGNVKGTLVLGVPNEYFEPEFLPDLAKKKTLTYQGIEFKYEGTTTISIGSRVYEGVQKIVIEDAKTLVLDHQRHIEFSNQPKFEGNGSLVIFRHPDIGAVEAVQFDLTGKVGRINYKVGFDVKH